LRLPEIVTHRRRVLAVMDEASDEKGVDAALERAALAADAVMPASAAPASGSAGQRAEKDGKGDDLFRRIFTEVLAEDGLLVLARGMGLRFVVERFIRVFCGGKNLVACLGMVNEGQSIRASLAAGGLAREHLPVVVTNEMPSAQRLRAYRAGGVVIITSRILVVDLLTGRLPGAALSGLLVARAHSLGPASSEAFIARLFRDANPDGFVKAFSEDPEALAGGFNRLESLMAALGVRQLFLWPRFHALAQSHLTRPGVAPEVVDLAQPMTPCMLAIQRCLVVAMDGCLQELKASPHVELDDVDASQGLLDGFDSRIRRRLDPVWGRLSPQTRQVASDVRLLRRLLSFLLRYDSVTFYAFLLSLRQGNQYQARDSLWLMSAAAEELYRRAKARVFVVEAAGRRAGRGVTVSESDDVTLARTARGLERTVFAIPGLEPAEPGGAAGSPAEAQAAATGGERRRRLAPVLEVNPKLRLLRSVLAECSSAWGQARRGTGGGAALPRRAGVVVATADALSAAQARAAVTEGLRGAMRRQFRGLVVRNAEVTASLRWQWRSWREHRAASLGLVPRSRARRGVPPRLPEPEWTRTPGGGAVLSADVGTSVSAAHSAHFGQQAAVGNPPTAPAAGGGAASRPAPAGGPVPRRVIVTAEQRLLWLEASRILGAPQEREAAGGTASAAGPPGSGAEAALGDPDSLDEDAAAALADLASPDDLAARRGRPGQGLMDDVATLLDDAVPLEDGRARKRGRERATAAGRQPKRPAGVPGESGPPDGPAAEGSSAPDPAGAATAGDEEGWEDEDVPVLRVGRLDVRVLSLADHESRGQLLARWRPAFVVVVDPDAAFVREAEVYAATAAPPGRPVRVYFTRFANSAEDQLFRLALQKEEDAFQKLIHAKAHMAVPRRASAAVERAAETVSGTSRGVDAWGISMEDSRQSRSYGTLARGGGQASKMGRTSAGALGGVKDAGRRRVVVDIREFRSKLPALLHAAGMEVVPVTLEVGDYVLAPRVCVERKSVPDLLGSLASGRLYTQCVAMCRFYDTAVLLVEFDEDRPFGLQSAGPRASQEGPALYDVHSKLALLTLHFPRLRILWARSPHAAVDMILAIKVSPAPRASERRATPPRPAPPRPAPPRPAPPRARAPHQLPCPRRTRRLVRPASPGRPALIPRAARRLAADDGARSRLTCPPRRFPRRSNCTPSPTPGWPWPPARRTTSGSRPRPRAPPPRPPRERLPRRPLRRRSRQRPTRRRPPLAPPPPRARWRGRSRTPPLTC